MLGLIWLLIINAMAFAHSHETLTHFFEHNENKTLNIISLPHEDLHKGHHAYASHNLNKEDITTGEQRRIRTKNYPTRVALATVYVKQPFKIVRFQKITDANFDQSASHQLINKVKILRTVVLVV